MSNDIAKALKQKTDAMLRLQGQSQKPVVYENVDGSYTAPEKSEYTAALAQGKNIKITTSGNIKTISAVMNLLAGSNITISEPDENGAVTITGTIAGKEVNITDFTGKNGYSLVYDETSDKFILSEVTGGGAIAQATETVLGGIKAKTKTTETSEVAIDPATGKLYGPSPDAAVNGLPSGGTAGQILNKIDGADYNAKWIDAPSGGASYANAIDIPPVIPNAKDDEFNGASLDLRWLWVNRGAAVVVVENKLLKFTAPIGSIACRGIVQSAPTSIDFTLVAKFLGCTYWGSYAKVGLLISESLTGKQLGIWHAYDGAWKGLMGEFFSTPASRSSFAYYGSPVQPQGGYIKVRIYQNAGVWYVDFYYSLNGFVWITEKIGLALGFTPAYIGLGLDYEISVGNTHDAFFDWFRVTQI